MERLLLNLDVANPSSDDLNAIFRCAHSIKGGAATFGFTHMTELTHVAESILDRARTGTLQLRENMVDAFLETKDVLKSQLDAYRQEHPIDTATLEYMVAKLNSLTAEDGADESIRSNAQTDGALLERIATPDDAGRTLLAQAVDRMRLSARGFHRVLKVARTLADLDGTDGIRRAHIAEALSYRRIAPQGVG